MNLVLVLLWIYGMWSGWKQLSYSRGIIGSLVPQPPLQWLNQNQVPSIAVKAFVSLILGGIFAVFGLIALLLKLMHGVSKM